MDKVELEEFNLIMNKTQEKKWSFVQSSVPIEMIETQSEAEDFMNKKNDVSKKKNLNENFEGNQPRFVKNEDYTSRELNLTEIYVNSRDNFEKDSLNNDEKYGKKSQRNQKNVKNKPCSSILYKNFSTFQPKTETKESSNSQRTSTKFDSYKKSPTKTPLFPNKESFKLAKETEGFTSELSPIQKKPLTFRKMSVQDLTKIKERTQNLLEKYESVCLNSINSSNIEENEELSKLKGDYDVMIQSYQFLIKENQRLKEKNKELKEDFEELKKSSSNRHHKKDEFKENEEISYNNNSVFNKSRITYKDKSVDFFDSIIPKERVIKVKYITDEPEKSTVYKEKLDKIINPKLTKFRRSITPKNKDIRSTYYINKRENSELKSNLSSMIFNPDRSISPFLKGNSSNRKMKSKSPIRRLLNFDKSGEKEKIIIKTDDSVVIWSMIRGPLFRILGLPYGYKDFNYVSEQLKKFEKKVKKVIKLTEAIKKMARNLIPKEISDEIVNNEKSLWKWLKGFFEEYMELKSIYLKENMESCSSGQEEYIMKVKKMRKKSKNIREREYKEEDASFLDTIELLFGIENEKKGDLNSSKKGYPSKVLDRRDRVFEKIRHMMKEESIVNDLKMKMKRILKESERRFEERSTNDATFLKF